MGIGNGDRHGRATYYLSPRCFIISYLSSAYLPTFFVVSEAIGSSTAFHSTQAGRIRSPSMRCDAMRAVAVAVENLLPGWMDEYTYATMDDGWLPYHTHIFITHLIHVMSVLVL